MILVPGTRIGFETLRGWLRAVRELDARRCSTPTHTRMDALWDVLPDAVIDAAPREQLVAFVELLAGPNNRPWGKPCRGARGGTKWERLNVRARNRISNLDRQADRDSIPDGPNMRTSPHGNV